MSSGRRLLESLLEGPHERREADLERGADPVELDEIHARVARFDAADEALGASDPVRQFGLAEAGAFTSFAKQFAQYRLLGGVEAATHSPQ